MPVLRIIRPARRAGDPLSSVKRGESYASNQQDRRPPGQRGSAENHGRRMLSEGHDIAILLLPLWLSGLLPLLQLQLRMPVGLRLMLRSRVQCQLLADVIDGCCDPIPPGSSIHLAIMGDVNANPYSRRGAYRRIVPD